MIKPYEMQVNLKAENRYSKNIVISSDNANKLIITLVQDGETVDLTGKTIELLLKNQSGDVFIETTSIVNNKIECTLSVGSITKSGRYEVQLKITEASEIVRSSVFYLDIELALDDAGSIVPSNQLPNYKNDIDTVNARIDTLLNGSPVGGELEDIRVDSTGKTWPKAGDNVRNIGKSLLNTPKENLIINGDFRIQQRGTDFTFSPFNPKYTADRWFVFSGGSSEINLLKDNTIDFIRVKGSALGQLVTGLVPGVYTISCFVKSSNSTKAFFQISSSNSIPDETILHYLSLDITNSWSKKEFTFILGENTKNYISIRIGLENITSNSIIDIKNVKLEYGEYSTPFLPKIITDELAHCQRYYQVRSSDNINPLDLRPSMRINPTITDLGGGRFSYDSEIY